VDIEFPTSPDPKRFWQKGLALLTKARLYAAAIRKRQSPQGVNSNAINSFQ